MAMVFNLSLFCSGKNVSVIKKLLAEGIYIGSKENLIKEKETKKEITEIKYGNRKEYNEMRSFLKEKKRGKTKAAKRK